MISNFTNFCCVCFKADELIVLKSLIEDEGENSDIATFFANGSSKLANYEETECEMICWEDVDRLSSSIGFIEKAKEADKYYVAPEVGGRPTCRACLLNNTIVDLQTLNEEDKELFQGMIGDENHFAEVRMCEKCIQDFELVCKFSIDLMKAEDKFEDKEQEEDFECFFDETITNNLNQQHNNKQLQEKSDSIAEDQVMLRVKTIRRSRKRSEKFICDLCGKILEEREKFRRHLLSHIKPFKCECGKSFGSRQNLNQHKPTHDEDRTKFSCIYCSSSSYSTRGHLNRHIKFYHFTVGEKFKCDKCTYEGKSEDHLKRHQRIHQKPLKCNKCDKRFSENKLLKSHLKKHDEPDKFVCLCSRVFKSSQALNHHKTMMHKAGEPIEIDNGTYTCNICQKIFGRECHLINHLKTHEEKKKCPICFKMFSVRSLKIHIRHHQLKEEGKQFKCQKCSKAFLTSQYLKDHLKWHNKQFECDFCGHRVASKNAIKSHTKRHVGYSDRLTRKI